MTGREGTNETKESSSQSLPKISGTVLVALRKRFVGSVAVSDLTVDSSEKMLGRFVVTPNIETCRKKKVSATAD